MTEQTEVVRTARGAGRWFPASGKQLTEMVNAYIDEAGQQQVTGKLVAAIAPHAGYPYSGPVAGYVFRAIKDNAAALGAPETVVVLGLSHRGGFKGVALMDGKAFETPMGRVSIDTEAVEELTGASELIYTDYGPHASEHSAENEVPFVQAALPNARIVIGIIGDHSDRAVSELAGALVSLSRRKKILVVASSDMLHSPDYDLVTKTDKKTLELVKNMDIQSVASGWSYDNQTFCGIAPVLTAMTFAKDLGCTEATLLRYRNSGDDHPESRGSWVVGYGAVAFTTSD